MVKAANEFGVVGLGRMGGGLAVQALGKKMVVAGFELRAHPRSCAKPVSRRSKASPDFVRR